MGVKIYLPLTTWPEMYGRPTKFETTTQPIMDMDIMDINTRFLIGYVYNDLKILKIHREIIF